MEKKNFLLSGVLTLFVIVVVILSGPAAAITIGVTDLANTVNGGQPVSFKTMVDLHKNDLVPENSKLVVKITNEKGLPNYECTFNLLGNPLTTCANIAVSLHNKDVERLVGTASAYGFDGHDRTTLTGGYGYGFALVEGQGYYNFSNVLASNAELSYDVVWTTPKPVSNTQFTITVAFQSVDDPTFNFETSSNNAGRIMVFGTQKK